MLNTNEIRDIESKWKKYKRKIYLKYFLVLFFFFAMIGGLAVYKFFPKLFSVKNEKIVLKKDKESFQKNIHKKNDIKKGKIEKKVKQKKVQKIQEPKSSSAIEKKIDINRENSVKNKAVVLTLNTDFIDNIYKNYEKNGTKKSEIKKTIPQKTHEQKANEKKSSENKPGRKKIVISSQKIDKLKYLRKRFEDTGKAFYAVSLSKEYYKRGKYKKSLEWSIKANNIDSQNEESWIMFAKSKVKLHKKIDAINALQAYLKINSSRRVKVLLSNIKAGVFK